MKQLCLIIVLATPVALLGQQVIFDQQFDDAANDADVWSLITYGQDSIDIHRGNLRLATSTPTPSGLITQLDKFPLFRRPNDDTEYDIYFIGVRLADRPQVAAFGLYSLHGGDSAARLPRDFRDDDRMSYAFCVTPGEKEKVNNKHWISTMLSGSIGAACDSTGPDGFHTWEYGAICDFRIQVTKHDTTWWGRTQPSKDWMPLQDPAMAIGYDGNEVGGRNDFGLFVSAHVGDVQIDRIYATRYTPIVLDTILREPFQNEKLDENVWSVVVPDASTDKVTNGKSLQIKNGGENGSAWHGGAGIWTNPDQFPLFERPSDVSQRVYIDFLGVELPSIAQRCALGLYSVNPGPTGKPKFPDGYGQEDGPAYFFWVLPDNDRLVENSNQLRAGVIDDKYAATDNFHHAWIWPYTERRDLRLEVTSDDVRWYMRTKADSAWRVVRDSTEFFYRRPAIPEDRSSGYWRPLYDPGVVTKIPFNGNEANGRNRFGVFVHVSAAGSDGPNAWNDGELKIEEIRVTVVTHADSTQSPK